MARRNRRRSSNLVRDTRMFHRPDRCSCRLAHCRRAPAAYPRRPISPASCHSDCKRERDSRRSRVTRRPVGRCSADRRCNCNCHWRHHHSSSRLLVPHRSPATPAQRNPHTHQSARSCCWVPRYTAAALLGTDRRHHCRDVPRRCPALLFCRCKSYRQRHLRLRRNHCPDWSGSREAEH